MIKHIKDQRGVAHVAVVIGALLFIGVAGLIVWRVMDAQQPGTSNTSVANVPCDYDDENLCAFLSNWANNHDYSVTATHTVGGVTTTSLFESSHNGERFHTKTEMNGTPYETITIGNDIYTKSNTDGTWWKQTSTPAEVSDLDSTYDHDFTAEESGDPTSPAPEYKSLGTEACGELTCYKYQLIDQSVPETTQYIWFDTNKHMLRRMLIEAADSTNDQIFYYGKVSIEVPSPVKELGPNQTFNPMTGEPVTYPTDFGQ